MSRPLRVSPSQFVLGGVTEEAPPTHRMCAVLERSAVAQVEGWMNDPPSRRVSVSRPALRGAGVRSRADGRPTASRMADLMPNHIAGSVSVSGGGSPDAGRAREDREAAAEGTWWIDRICPFNPAMRAAPSVQRSGPPTFNT